MEAVGVAASLITLVALAKEISTAAHSLLRDFQNAPKELDRISNQVSLILTALKFLSGLQQLYVGNLLSDEDDRSLRQSLIAAKSNITDIHTECVKRTKGKSRITSRLAWAIFDSKTVDGFLSQLQRTESSLNVVLQTINVKASMRIREENAINTANILRQLDVYQDSVQRQPYSTGNRTGASTSADDDSLIAFRYVDAGTLPNFWKSKLEVDARLIRSQNDFQNAYDFYLRLPFFTFTTKMAIILSFSFRRVRGFLPNLTILGSGLNFVNLVPVDSDIVKACRRGDFIAVRDLFRRGKASPTDMSVDDRTLLWHAASSGNADLVRFLISAGSPVRSSYLMAASFWRQPEIARLFLHSGADVEVLSTDGFTAAFYLFGSRRTKVPQTEFLEIMAGNSFSNFNAQDVKGWTALHRAAAFGTTTDIKKLVRLGASLTARTYNLQWTPLWAAVCFSNLETLQELWDLYGDPNLKDTKDLRGWNLLHVAAGAGNIAAIPYLLEKNVDTCGISQATTRFVPSCLRERCVTPNDVARNCGEEAYKKWTEALHSAGRDIDIQPDDIDWPQEDVDGKFGGCECCDEWGF